MTYQTLTCVARSCVFGEDVGFGGVFRCTVGLQVVWGQGEGSMGWYLHGGGGGGGRVIAGGGGDETGSN